MKNVVLNFLLVSLGNFTCTASKKSSLAYCSVWSKTTLITSGVGEAGVNTPTSKKGRFFVISLAYHVSIFNKIFIGHKLRNVPNFNTPNFVSYTTLPEVWDIPQLVSDNFFFKIGTLKFKPFFEVGETTPVPPTATVLK